MNKIEQYKESLRKIKGKTVAIVYIFEGDTGEGFEHFYIWKSNIIAKWMNAVQELSCLPLIIDVRTFIDKAINRTLPHIDYVLNLNSGTYNLSTMALVPAMCSAMNVPCIPCNAVSIVTGEQKELSNHIASSLGIKVPKTLNPSDNTGIFRPINLGNSLGVHRGYEANTKGLYQEFIPGYEITTPIVYNPLLKEMDILPTVVFQPISNDPAWYYGEKDKTAQTGYKFCTINLEDSLKKKYIDLVNTLSIQTFCRIDARIKCENSQKLNSILEVGGLLDNTYFIEINVMPTIRDNNSFCYSFNKLTEDTPLYQCIQLQKEIMGTININSFLLACSMISFR